jgi:hypothetical protein
MNYLIFPKDICTEYHRLLSVYALWLLSLGVNKNPLMSGFFDAICSSLTDTSLGLLLPCLGNNDKHCTSCITIYSLVNKSTVHNFALEVHYRSHLPLS